MKNQLFSFVIFALLIAKQAHGNTRLDLLLSIRLCAKTPSEASAHKDVSREDPENILLCACLAERNGRTTSADDTRVKSRSLWNG